MPKIGFARRVLVLMLVAALAAPTAFASAQANEIVPLDEAMDVLNTFAFNQALLEQCGVITGDVDGYEEAWWEWLSRNDYTDHLATVVVTFHGGVIDKAAQRALAERTVGLVVGSYENPGGMCARTRVGIFSGTADLSQINPDQFDRLLASDRAITELRRK